MLQNGVCGGPTGIIPSSVDHQTVTAHLDIGGSNFKPFTSRLRRKAATDTLLARYRRSRSGSRTMFNHVDEEMGI